MRKAWLMIELMLLIAVALILPGMIFPEPVYAQSSGPTYPVSIYLFWGDGCPHCAVAKPFLESLSSKYPNVEFRNYEVWYAPENQDLFIQLAATYGFEPHYVPTIFVGDHYWEGFTDQVGQEIENAVMSCSVSGCVDHGAGVIPGVSVSFQPEVQSSIAGQASESIQIPILGTVNLASQSLWVSTALIAFVDGVNPCSVWVLMMLLAITLHSGSRKRVFMIGMIFLTVTAGIYALFIAGLFTVFSIVNFVGWIQIGVALVALFFALVNIKDYFWYQEGISFTISRSKKPGIYQRMRRLVDGSSSFWGLAGATIVLAAGVSLVEFSCTAGFPVLWTNLLVSQEIAGLAFVSLLILYLLIYQIDEMAIFFTAVYTFKASKLEEKHGRILKLIGGMLMLTLAVVMLVNPALMNNLTSTLYIFGAALSATLLVLLVHRTILPRVGIRLGTFQGRSRTSKKRARRHSPSR